MQIMDLDVKLCWDFVLFYIQSQSDFLIFAGQVVEDLRERFFGPSFELSSHDKVCNLFEELKVDFIWSGTDWWLAYALALLFTNE